MTHHPITAIHINNVIPDWTWEQFKPNILLRQLLDEKRAVSEVINEDDAVIAKLFTEVPLDVFRYLLTFFIRAT